MVNLFIILFLNQNEILNIYYTFRNIKLLFMINIIYCNLN